MKKNLELFTDYNFWANKKILDFVGSLHDNILNRDTPSSFRSLKKTLLHIWDAELVWVSRLKGKSVDFWPSQQLDANSSVNGLLDISLEWVNFIKSKDTSYFEQNCYYKSIGGQQYDQQVFEIVMHCMNHSTFHRGQIITMLRAMDYNDGMPITDMITFSRERIL